MEVTTEQPQQSEGRLESLAVERDRWLAFLRRRVRSDAEAEDILQDSLLRAMQGVGQLRQGEDLFAWFYRVLRHALVDGYRKEAAVSRREERLAIELSVSFEADFRSAQSRQSLCACLRPRLSRLNSRYARILEAVDLEGKTVGQVAAEEGITVGSIHVTLHRARQALRRELVRFCGMCAAQCCRDCSCEADHAKTCRTRKFQIRCKNFPAGSSSWKRSQ